MTAPVLEVVDLVKQYPVRRGPFEPRKIVHALDGVSLTVRRGETLAIVGESGCGKSTLARCLLRLEDPTGGTIRLHGADITSLDADAMRPLRRHVQIVFQDPYASLNPRWSIGTLMADPLRLHTTLSRAERRVRAAELLAIVGLGGEFLERYPHELSGGQRQRVAIARALAVEPDAIVCDEPVSALDVSIQAQVINLLMRLRREFGIALVFISHDLSLVKHIADRIAVMYLGQIVELADAAEMREGAKHPYSRALFAAAPTVDPVPGASREAPIGGDVPSPIDPPSGCRFHTRCAFAKDECARTPPALRAVEGRAVRCHFAGEIDFERWAGRPA
jgi:oligopeptide/dipeptide ABC transporter ATP-binding protein